MVVDHFYGSQVHFRAAHKFLKNRTLRLMAGNKMTLYDRIMAYRKLKEGDEVEEGQARPAAVTSQRGEGERHQGTRSADNAPTHQAAAARGSPAGSRPSSGAQEPQQHRRSSAPARPGTASEERSAVKAAVVVTERTEKREAKRPSPVPAAAGVRGEPRAVPEASKRVESGSAGRGSASRSASRKLERSDTSFASVDISDLTQLENEDEKRSPSPQPTFDHARGEDRSAHHQAQATARDVVLHVEDKQQFTEKGTSSSTSSSRTAAMAVAASTSKSTEIRKTKEERNTNSATTKAGSLTSQRAENIRNEEYSQKKKIHEGVDAKNKNRKDVKQAAVVTKSVSETKQNKREQVDDVVRSENSRVDKEKSVSVTGKHTESQSSQKSEKLTEEKSKLDKVKDNISADRAGKVAVAVKVASEITREDRRSSSKMEEKQKQKSKSKAEENSFEMKEMNVRASITEPRTPEPTKTPQTTAVAVKGEKSPQVKASPNTKTAAASKPRARSPRSKAKQQREEQAEIAALEKLADKNLSNLLGNNAGSDDVQVDQKILDKVFSPSFQAELDEFLRS